MQGRGTGGSGHGCDGSWKAQGTAAAETGTQSWCAQLRQWQSAAAEAGVLWERRRQRLGASGLRWEGERM